MKKSIAMIDNHPCPVCNHKIGMHTNSIFGHNPEIEMSGATGESAHECPRSYNELVIEKLTAWWNDAMDERDAYIKSYKEASENSHDYFVAFTNMLTVASEAAQDRNILQKKLDIAMEALNWYSENALHEHADKAIAEIGRIK